VDKQSEMIMTKRSTGDAKKKGTSQRIVLISSQKDQVDAFFIGMSGDKEDYKNHQRTLSEQAEYKEHI